MAHLRWLLAASCIALVTCVALAEAPRGDPQHGKALTAGPPELKSEQACASCHGDTGEGNPGSAIPRLAAQSQDYLLRALAEYAGGLRQNEIMTPIAKALSDTQRADVTAYYAALPEAEWTKPPPPGQQSMLRRGEALATVGQAAEGVQGCSNCHGPQGRGLPPMAPYLAGQPAEYLASRLKDWRDAPTGDEAAPFTIMARIAQRLSDEDVAAVAAYFAQQKPDAIRLGQDKAEQAQ